MRSGKICILLFFFLLPLTRRGLAQTEHIHFRHFSLQDGLSSYKVVKVLQDHYGFIWLATQDGLGRFDGKNMRIYNKSASGSHLLSGTDITDILEDTGRNLLWAISTYGGLNGIDLITGNVKYSLPEADSVNHFSNAWLKCMVLFRNEIWIGSLDSITIIDPDRGGFIKTIAVPFKKSKGNDGFDINLMWVDEYDRVWVFVANYGLVLYSAKDHAVVTYFDLAVLHLKENHVARSFHDCLHVAKDQLLLATSQGIKRIRYNKDISLDVSDEKIPGEEDKEIISIKQDSSKNLWFATNKGLFKFEAANGYKTAIRDDNRADQHIWLGLINSIFFDRHDNLWLGTLYGLSVAAHPHPVFQSFFQSSDFKAAINRAYYVFPLNDSVEFVCAEDGFYRVDNSSGHISQIKAGTSFSFMFQHPDGSLIVSSENHLFIFRPPDRFTAIEKRYPEFSSIKSQNINSAVYCGDSVVLLGSEDDQGVYNWDFKHHSIDIINSRSASPLKSDIVNTVYKDHSDRIWILSDNSFALYYPKDKKLINYKLKNPESGQPLNLFFDVREMNGSYWLAAYGSGIIELDTGFRIKKIITPAQGMANSGVYKLFPVHDSLLYVTSNNGLCKINVIRNSVSNYFTNDGLHSNAFEEACGMDKNGKIYAGGLKGFSIINTDNLGWNNRPPKVYFNNVSIQTSKGTTDTSNLFMESVVMPSNTLQANIYFCGINYSNPEKTVYAFRIKEQNESWISIGTDNHMVVSGFPPGTYTLQVRAANEDGLWSQPVELMIHFLPKWYQSGWFKILVLICLGGILYALYRYRIGQLKKTLMMRTKISRDLHDEVGSSLSGIGLMSELAKHQLKSENIPEAQNSIDKIIVNADEVLAMMSDIVWAINPKNDTFEKMITRLKSYAQNTTASHDILLHFESDEHAQQYNLTMQQRKNIYLICKESINNAVRYSACRNLYFILRRDRSQFYICVKDDGKGFDVEQASEGNGLYNMRARAKEVKAVLKIESWIDTGTAITVLLRIT